MTSEKRERTFRGGNARQGSIVLRTRLHQAIFITGLAGIVVLSILLALT